MVYGEDRIALSWKSEERWLRGFFKKKICIAGWMVEYVVSLVSSLGWMVESFES